MSVAIYSNSELLGLAERLGGLDQSVNSMGETLGCILQSLALANRAAYAMTYGEAHSEPMPSFEGEASGPGCAGWSATQWAKNLVYNTITNGGRKYAPRPDENALIALAERVDAARLANVVSIR